MSVKLIHSILDEDPKGEYIMRGVLDPKSFASILVDTYQREVLPLSTLSSLAKAFVDRERIPDITLGMRGGSYLDRDEVTFLQDPVYVIDGLQRLSAAMHLMRNGKLLDPYLGCCCYFNTTKESETDLFRQLNTKGVKLSPGILLRNLKDNNAAIGMLYNLCQDKSFVLYDRVSWNQRMKRHELLAAFVLLKSVAHLHTNWGRGLSSHLDDVARGVENTMRSFVGRNTMRDNIKTFFEVIDGAWGIRSITFKEGASYMKAGFLFGLAGMFAIHRNFWTDQGGLTIPPDIRKKLAMFPVNDPLIVRLAGTGASIRFELTRQLTEFINSSKRTRRLIPFKQADAAMEPEIKPGEEAVS